MDLTPEERRRLNVYIASQNDFVTETDETIARIIIAWMEKHLPQAIARVRRAAQDAWETIRDWLGW